MGTMSTITRRLVHLDVDVSMPTLSSQLPVMVYSPSFVNGFKRCVSNTIHRK